MPETILPGVDEAVGALGLDLAVTLKLDDGEQLGIWIAEQPDDVQADVLLGYLTGLGESHAVVMLRMVAVGKYLRVAAEKRVEWVSSPLEHLLRGVRGLGGAS